MDSDRHVHAGSRAAVEGHSTDVYTISAADTTPGTMRAVLPGSWRIPPEHEPLRRCGVAARGNGLASIRTRPRRISPCWCCTPTWVDGRLARVRRDHQRGLAVVDNVQDDAPERVVLRCGRRPAVERAVHGLNVGCFTSLEPSKDSRGAAGSWCLEARPPRLFPPAGQSLSTSEPNVLDFEDCCCACYKFGL